MLFRSKMIDFEFVRYRPAAKWVQKTGENPLYPVGAFS